MMSQAGDAPSPRRPQNIKQTHHAFQLVQIRPGHDREHVEPGFAHALER